MDFGIFALQFFQLLIIIIISNMIKQRSDRRLTRQRRTVLKVLRGNGSHMTARDLYDGVRRFLPRISLGTVYRNLEVLVGEGLAIRLDFIGRPGEAGTRYDATVAPHAHVCCHHCHRIDDLSVPPPTEAELRLAAERGYKILCRHVSYTGVCPDCRRDGDDSGPTGAMP
jgi:Fur family ferric uptake transcriptional regulator